MMLAKAVLRSPPCGGRKKWYAVKAIILERLRCWQRDDLVSLWLETRIDRRPREATCGRVAMPRAMLIELSAWQWMADLVTL